MTTILLSDAHLQGPGHPAHDAFLRFLDVTPLERLVIVGDLFDLWLVPPGQVPRKASRVIDRLYALQRAGVDVQWLRGNHDPSHRPFPGAQTWRTRVGSAEVLAVHGDEGLDDGLPNRVLQRLLCSRRVARATRFIGVERVWSLGRGLSDLSRFRHTSGGLQRALEGQERLARGLLVDADTVVVGHTHAPGRVSLPGGELINLGDWFEHRTYLKIDMALELLSWGPDGSVRVEGPPRRRPELLY